MTQSAQFSKGYYVFLIVFLGMLSAFGPFVTDMYLPTLPSMAEIFHTTPSLVQMGLATSMIGLAAGQIFFGPLSDKYGRRRVLMAAMILFAVSTVISIYSPSIEFFNICRFVQGLGGAGGIVLSRSI
ncbi:MAG: MFS transporter, partial [Muribaculaceae bacterium]|nr:MFS transporter [Muribaculaceae bacterium]